jgi:hypothetical protein
MMIEYFSFSGQAMAFFWVSGILLCGDGHFHGVMVLGQCSLSFERSFTKGCILVGVTS